MWLFYIAKYVAFRPNWNKSVCHELTKLYYKTLRGKMANITSLTWVPEFQKKIQNQILNQYLGRNVDLRTIFKGIKYGVKTSTIYIRPIWHLWRQRLLLYSNISPILTSLKLQRILTTFDPPQPLWSKRGPELSNHLI